MARKWQWGFGETGKLGAEGCYTGVAAYPGDAGHIILRRHPRIVSHSALMVCLSNKRPARLGSCLLSLYPDIQHGGCPAANLVKGVSQGGHNIGRVFHRPSVCTAGLSH